MTEDTFRTAFQQASSELRAIQEQFEKLCTKKERIERLVEVLRPMLDMEPMSVSTPREVSDPALFLVEESVQASTAQAVRHPEPVSEPVLEPELATEMAPEPVQFSKEAATDPFQRRIESVLWGWSQKREGMAPAV